MLTLQFSVPLSAPPWPKKVFKLANKTAVTKN